MDQDCIASQSSRLTCKIPTALLLRVEDRRHNHLKDTGKRLTLRRVIETALERWLRDEEVAP